MKIYIAHNFAARTVLHPIVEELRTLGHEITSSWITDASHLDVLKIEESAKLDLEDIDDADALLLFIDQFGKTPGRGKYVELGYAIAKGKLIFLNGIGMDECVFYALPQMTIITSLDQLPMNLGQLVG